MLLPGLLLLILTAVPQTVAQNHPAAVLTASQCFNSRSRIPKVMFGCSSPSHMIKVLRAFHGVRASGDDDAMRTRQCADVIKGELLTRDPLCTYCPGDCVDDSINEVYDWSSCIGARSCVRTVLQSYAPSCPGSNKFTHYLQVDYQCIPREDVLDICRTTRRITSAGGELTSPGYPNNYPANSDCMCTLSADDPSSRLVLSLYDIVLQTKMGRCRADWLMLREGTHKHRHCGVLTSGTQNLTTSSSLVTLQFHSDADDEDHENVDDNDKDADVGDKMQSVTQSERQPQQPRRLSRTYKGFWLRFEADRRTSISVNCHRLDTRDPAAVEARADNEDYDDQQSTPPPPTPPRPQPPPLLSALPPSGPTDIDFRRREAAGEGLGRQEATELHDLAAGQDEEGEAEVDLWPRSSDDVDKTAPRLEPGNDDGDMDTHRRFEISSTEERHVVTSGSATSVAGCDIFITTPLSLWVCTAIVLLLYRH